MKLRPLQITSGVIVGVLIGGAAVYQIGHEPIRRIVDDPVASFRRLTTDQPRPAPLSEKEQQRLSEHQAQAKAYEARQRQSK